MQEDSGEQIIQELRQRAEDQAQRKSEKIKAEAFLLNKPIASTSLFGSNKAPESVSLFTGKKTVNIFQLYSKPNNLSLDSNSNTLEDPAKNAEISSENSMNLEQRGGKDSESSFQTEPDCKMMKYEYKQELEKVREMSIKKFKCGTSAAIENIYVTLEKYPNQTGILHLVVRSNATKIVIYQGVIMKNVSKISHFFNKRDNLKLEILKKSNDSPTVSKEVVKLQFFNEENCQEFQEAIKACFQQ